MYFCSFICYWNWWHELSMYAILRLKYLYIIIKNWLLKITGTPYLTDIVGKTKFANAFGIVNLFRGFACFIGPFVGGYLSDQFKSSLVAFWFSAICFTLGFIFSAIVSIGNKFNCNKNSNNDEKRYNSV